MAFVNDIQRFESKLVARMRSALEEARRHYTQRRAYRATYEELNALTDRELSDLGISRSEIPSVAREAAGMK